MCHGFPRRRGGQGPGWSTENDEKVDDAIEKAGDLVDDKTDDKYAGQRRQGTGPAPGEDRRGRHQPVIDPATGVATAGTIDRFVVVPASYVFFLRDDRVLLQLRQNTGFMDGHWAAAAAGHVEKGETAYDAARREAAEEVGVTDLELEFVTAMQRTRGGEPIDERIDFFFTCRSWSGEHRIVEPTKAAALEWFDLDALPDPVVPHELAVLQGLTAASPRTRPSASSHRISLVEEGALAPVTDPRRFRDGPSALLNSGRGRADRRHPEADHGGGRGRRPRLPGVAGARPAHRRARRRRRPGGAARRG